jgi:hypothetical protein
MFDEDLQTIEIVERRWWVRVEVRQWTDDGYYIVRRRRCRTAEAAAKIADEWMRSG